MTPEEAGEQFARAQQDVEELQSREATSWSVVSALWRRFKRLDADGVHVYLSTSCLHEEHDYCQSDKGNNGAVSWYKMPGECKSCSAKCVCDCHREATDVAA